MPGCTRPCLSLLLLSILFSPAVLPPAIVTAEDSPPDGKTVYAEKCVRCHGREGQGSENVDGRLTGTLSVAQLAKLVQETMPEDDPETLTAAESKAVADYIHNAFYSAVARDRNRPARVALARLTVRQHRQVLTDLIGLTGVSNDSESVPGLQAKYAEGRGGGKDSQSLERIDPQVNFEFGQDSPVSEIEDAYEFTIHWKGSLLAPVSGEYEFRVRTEHATRLSINDEEIIDAWVKSGDDTEYTTTMTLTAGRRYPLELGFTKAIQGVNKEQKRDQPPPPASIVLLWNPPESLLEPIPSRYLTTAPVPVSYVCSTAFPPDDRSYGWERGTNISKEWDAAATHAAIEAAGYVDEHLNRLAGTHDEDSERSEKVRQFADNFVEAAFRRPLDESLQSLYIDQHFQEDRPLDVAIRRVVIMTLKSPRFLFREIDNIGDDYDIASRLSFGLWNSIPDESLRAAAAAGELSNPEELRRQAERMLEDPRAKRKLRGFLMAWVKCSDPIDLEKHLEHHPEFDAATMSDLQTSLELFLDDIIASETADFRELLTSENLFVNQRLARLYDDVASENQQFTLVRSEDTSRSGILTHPYLMARFSHGSESSPIHRGVFLARGMLGQRLKPPPEAVAPLAPDLHPDLTTRERVTLQTSAATCMTCHSIINPLGFTLEEFDAVGRYRQKDRNKPVESGGKYLTRKGEEVTFEGPRDLAQFLVSSDEAHKAFVEHMFHHLVQQPIRAFGSSKMSELLEAFRQEEFHIRKLAVEIMVASSPVKRETKVAATSD